MYNPISGSQDGASASWQSTGWWSCFQNRLRFVLGAIYDDDHERGYFWFDEVAGVEFSDNGDFDVLIGMDVISQGDLHVMRDGEFRWVLG